MFSLDLNKKVILILGSLVSLVTLLLSYLSYHIVLELQETQRFKEQIAINHYLDEAIRYQAIERGVGNSYLKGANELKDNWIQMKNLGHAEVEKAQELIQAYFRNHVHESNQNILSSWQNKYTNLEKARRDLISRNISSEQWLKTSTENIREGEFGIRDFFSLPKTDFEKQKYILSIVIPSLVWIAEYSGIERATIGGILAQNRSFSTEELLFLGGLRAKVDFCLPNIESLYKIDCLNEESTKKLNLFLHHFKGSYENIRQNIYNTTADQPLPYTTQEWIEHSTKSIDQMFDLANTLDQDLLRLNQNLQQKYYQQLIAYALIILTFISFFTGFYFLGTRKVLASLESTESSSQQIRKQGNDINMAISNLSIASRELGTLFQKIETQCNENSENTNRTAQLVHDFHEQIKHLDQLSSSIDRALQDIVDISKRTDMLALNATIEAANAGEAGRSFSVVASEVQHLAKNSKETSEAINLKIGDIQKTIRENVLISQEVGQASQSIATSTQTISQSTFEFSTTIQQVNQTILELEDSAQAIANEIEKVSNNMIEIMSGKALP